ncbi:MAG: hypothetical protein ACI4EJ_08425, partial [Bacteroides sp.]
KTRRAGYRSKFYRLCTPPSALIDKKAFLLLFRQDSAYTDKAVRRYSVGILRSKSSLPVCRDSIMSLFYHNYDKEMVA